MVSHHSLLVVMCSCCGWYDGEAPRPSTEAAQRIARDEERAEGIACPTFAVGSDVRIGEFSYRLERPSISHPETRLPWIESEQERRALADSAALVVPFSITNHGSEPRTPSFSVMLLTRDGASHHGWADNEKLWARGHHRLVVHELARLAPAMRVSSGFVFDVDPDELANAVVYFQQVSYVRDRTGAHRMVFAHAIADLAPAELGDAIRGD